jgi:hypothetical protein
LEANAAMNSIPQHAVLNGMTRMELRRAKLISASSRLIQIGMGGSPTGDPSA